MIRRIHITGASGTGTSTLGSGLARTLRTPHIETDDAFWLPSEPPFQEIRPEAERRALLRERLAASDRWVLSGSLCGWGDFAIPRFQLVIFLSAPTALRLERLRRRERERFGEDALAPGGSMHANHKAFIEWASRYDEGDARMRSRALHESWLAELRCPALRLDGRHPLPSLLDQVLAALHDALDR
jgi:adenylate kinase family enzyme